MSFRTTAYPLPIVSDPVVRLDVPHIRQQPDLCVPTSSTMILRYFGETHDPVVLKRLAEEHKPPSQRNTAFTYWVDMRHALRQVGKQVDHSRLSQDRSRVRGRADRYQAFSAGQQPGHD